MSQKGPVGRMPDGATAIKNPIWSSPVFGTNYRSLAATNHMSAECNAVLWTGSSTLSGQTLYMILKNRSRFWSMMDMGIGLACTWDVALLQMVTGWDGC